MLARFLSKPANKKFMWVALALLVAAIGGGIYYYQQVYLGTQTSSEPSMQTATARKGDLVIYASGTGTLTALNNVDLGFKTGGQVKQINVKVGETVKAGDMLAAIDSASLEIKYTQAKRNLLELTSPAAIATAEEAVAAAQSDLQTAINHLAYVISPAVYYWETEVTKADQKVLNTEKALADSPDDASLKEKLEKEKAYLSYAKDQLKGSWYYYEHEYIRNNFILYDKKTKSKYSAAPTENDIAQARAGVTIAKANLKEAKYLYAALTGGEVPENATGSGLTELEQAKLNLESARVDLDGAKIITPIDGTVMAVDTSIGNTVGTTALITVADLSQRQLEVFLDVSNWDNIRMGYKTEVVFDILPDRTFTGRVIQVDPGLYTDGGTSAVRAIVQLDEINEGLNLPLGSSAAVDVIGGKAENAVLIPVEALHDAGDGQWAVFVLENGEPRLHLVEVGIKDLMSVEIISGVEAGDIVTTGIAETQ